MVAQNAFSKSFTCECSFTSPSCFQNLSIGNDNGRAGCRHSIQCLVFCEHSICKTIDVMCSEPDMVQGDLHGRCTFGVISMWVAFGGFMWG